MGTRREATGGKEGAHDRVEDLLVDLVRRLLHGRLTDRPALA